MIEKINQLKQKILFYFEKNQFKTAEKYIASILKKSEESEEILDMLAFSLLKQSKSEDAIKVYLKLIQKYDKNDYLIFFNLGNCLGNLGHREESIEYLKRSYSLNNKSFESLNNIGLQYEYSNKLDKAIKYYSSAIKINKEFELGYTNLAGVLEKQGELDKAHDLYEACLKINEINIDALLGLANINHMKKNYNQSNKLFLKVLKIDENSKNAYTGLGGTLLAQGKHENGLEMLKKGSGIVRFERGHEMKILCD